MFEDILGEFADMLDENEMYEPGDENLSALELAEKYDEKDCYDPDTGSICEDDNCPRCRGTGHVTTRRK